MRMKNRFTAERLIITRFNMEEQAFTEADREQAGLLRKKLRSFLDTTTADGDVAGQLNFISELKEQQRNNPFNRYVNEQRKKDLYKSTIDFMDQRGKPLFIPQPGGRGSAIGGAYDDLDYQPDMSDEEFAEVKDVMLDTLLSQYFPEEHAAKMAELERQSNLRAIEERKLRGPSQEEIDMLAGKPVEVKRGIPEQYQIGGRFRLI